MIGLKESSMKSDLATSLGRILNKAKFDDSYNAKVKKLLLKDIRKYRRR